MPPRATARPRGEGRLLQLVYYGYMFGSRLALALPERTAYRLAEILGSAGAHLSRRRANVALNLARITRRPAESAEVRLLVRDAYRSYARYWLETFRLVREGPDFWLDRFRCAHADRIDSVLAEGKGAIVVVGHLGNWDAAGAWAGARGNLLVTVAEVLRPRRMFEFFVEHRERLGMRIWPAEKGVTARLIEAVEAGAIVALVGDRDLKGTGPQVNFFGEPVTMPGGPASLSLRTGVPILVAGVYSAVFEDGKRGWRAEISLPINPPSERSTESIAELTQKVAGVLEEFVARRPEEWHVLQAFWPSDRARGQAR